MSKYITFIALLSFGLAACNSKKNESEFIMKESILLQKTDIEYPVATVEPTKLEKHGDTRIDNYYWMKLSDEQKNAAEPDEHTQRVIAYLEAENEYTKKMMSHTEGRQEDLYNEIVGRIKQTDISVPYKYNGYWYTVKYEEGKEYPIRVRTKDEKDATEEILLDENLEAEGKKYYATASKTVSPDNKILAFAEDVVSRRQYTIRFKDLQTGKYLTDQIKNTTGSIVWANDNKTIFYTLNDAALRSYKVMKHTLGTPQEKDTEVYHEKDETFGVYVWRTKSEKYIIIGSYATLSQEYRVLEADNPNGAMKIFQPRERNLEYSINHYADKWYIRTNKDDAKNFKIMTTPLDKTTKENWTDLIAHRGDVLVETIELFKNFMVIVERINGVTQLRVRSWDGENDHYVNFGEDSYLTYPTTNLDFDTDIMRLSYTSLTTPNSIYDYDMLTKELTLLKRQEVVGDFTPENYRSERVYATGRDGVKIPISIVYHKDFKVDGSRPLLLYGYGSYGASMDPYFSSTRLSLLDRGFAFAIAHIRGGEEMGRQWYEDGKFLKKINTFNDFIDCGEYLVKNKYCRPDKLFAQGGSAGGLLMGAITNMRPEMWAGIISQVPFVDVVTTMLDESIPLTTGEYDEWGNPNDKVYYDYMKSYSPYDNIEAKDYPPMLVTTGFHDSQVQYWEPAKYVAKMRAMKTDKNPLLLHCNMDVGHGGASGRFAVHKETAMVYAFLLDLAGL